MTTIDYFTKWVEQIPVKNATYTVVIKFLGENILSRFGCHQQIVTKNGKTFSGVKMIEFCQNHSILLHHSTPYYPQGDGLADSSDKSLVKVIKNNIEDHRKSWDNHLIHAI